MTSSEVSRLAALASPRLRLAAKTALVVEVGCIAWLASFGHIQQMQVQSFFLFNDKVAHLLAFLVAGLTASLAFRSLIWSALALSVVAGGVEIMQIFVPGRTASILDFAASLAGVAGGLALGAVLWPVLLKRMNRVAST
ncbi:VanZ family protein [Aquibium sp. ELW1220]|uniref:VanZ family protein n=1 Tax=Aquibium sp. ELW1220 TaxID=2976766 RepID=UPI0025B0196F|nr:VanZ family protein [Aquibium sp. ELW1220]MDN2578987.1 VanZ family protein [Aquibium sp. ELW1220]